MNVTTINNVVEKLELSNEMIFNENIKAYFTQRANNELQQGVGKFLFIYASENINTIINSNAYIVSDIIKIIF